MPETTPDARQGRSEVTRARVLDAAVRVLVEQGYAAASTLRIQEVAGVTRGRLLHQFPSRDELLVAAVRHLAGAQMDRIDGDVGPLPDDPGARIDGAVRAMWRHYCQDFFWAATELWVAARSHPELAAALRPAERELGERVRSGIDAKFGPDLVAHPAFRATGELLNTSMRGVALTYAFNGRRERQEADRHLDGWQRLARERLLPYGAGPTDPSSTAR